uniref:26S proteasome non-ATPase regulatory subunit 2 n=1 Tax=Palpitomonas bilix TaxID=652834 RepID=A0A7S3DF00_9EUKA|mmetsp:Transcript_34360/g.88831  ORF Transcript_34360/g.88831 Transcript_34360/m.88831 type:complete len:892 (+) Transcript_34360:74-2749(+)
MAPQEKKDVAPAAAKEENKKEKQKTDEELNEEDLKLQEEIGLLVERMHDSDEGVSSFALSTLVKQIREATSSMTSVPKPLKFLRAHYEKICTLFDGLQDGEYKKSVADLLALVAMTMAKEEGKPRPTLMYKLKGNANAFDDWGHEFVRHLAGEIGEEFEARISRGESNDELLDMVRDMVPFLLKHNVEPEACDLLMEVEKLPWILEHADERNYSRITLYLNSCAAFLSEPDNISTYRIVMEIFRSQKQYPDALRVALKIDDREAAKSLFDECGDDLIRKQMAYLLARQQVAVEVDEDDEVVAEIMNGTQLSLSYRSLAKELDVEEPKTPEDVYKSHLTDNPRSRSAPKLDSARHNLAATYVNAFVNMGFGNDKLLIGGEYQWLYKNKDHGMLAASASLGSLLLWDVDGGLSEIDKLLYSDKDLIKAGALLATGIINLSVRSDNDPALALLSEYVEDVKKGGEVQKCAVIGLGMAYAGSSREDVIEILAEFLESEVETKNKKVSMEIFCWAVLSIGLVCCGSGDNELANKMATSILSRSEEDWKQTTLRYAFTGLALIFTGRQEKAAEIVAMLRESKRDMCEYGAVTVDACAYAGTGNVLKMQEFQSICGEHLEEDVSNAHQAAAVLGMALVGMGEDIGTDMLVRSANHLLQYCDPHVKRAVPLALGMLHISNPKMTVMDALSRLTHDSDIETAMNAIYALGLIAAGTNNARISQLLRQLAGYYGKEQNALFMVRIAQGLVQMGKGLVTLSPFHSDRFLLSPVALAGTLVVSHACLDLLNTIMLKDHFVLHFLNAAAYPRMLVTLDTELENMSTLARVGQAVDTVGQAGKPKTITGFQTHSTPVLLLHGERAELASEEYIPLAPVLEGFVILKKNEDYKEEKDGAKSGTSSK